MTDEKLAVPCFFKRPVYVQEYRNFTFQKLVNIAHIFEPAETFSGTIYISAHLDRFYYIRKTFLLLRTPKYYTRICVVLQNIVADKIVPIVNISIVKCYRPYDPVRMTKTKYP